MHKCVSIACSVQTLTFPEELGNREQQRRGTRERLPVVGIVFGAASRNESQQGQKHDRCVRVPGEHRRHGSMDG